MSPSQSEPNYSEVVVSFNWAYTKRQRLVTGDITIATLAKEVDLSSFWTAFQRRNYERIRDLVALAECGISDNKTTKKKSFDHAANRELEEMSNRVQADTDMMILMYDRIQKRYVLILSSVRKYCSCSFEDEVKRKKQ